MKCDLSLRISPYFALKLRRSDGQLAQIRYGNHIYRIITIYNEYIRRIFHLT
jgi:hypothetical protein